MTAHDQIIREWAARPGRHIVNLSGGKDSTALAMLVSSASPTAWPRSSLTRLNPSRSTMHSDNGESADVAADAAEAGLLGRRRKRQKRSREGCRGEADCLIAGHDDLLLAGTR